MTVLVDFENDSVRTALEVADALGPRLWGVRLDTSSTMVDRSLWHEMGRFRPTGVVPELVWKVRRALDDAGHGAVRIVASGGFDARAHPRVRGGRRCRWTPTAWARSLLDGPNDYTADVVRVDGRARARRSAARSGPTRAWSGWSEPPPGRSARSTTWATSWPTSIGRSPPLGALARPGARRSARSWTSRAWRPCSAATEGGQVELIAPLDSESAIARFMEARGEGFHHVAFAVPDLRGRARRPALARRRADRRARPAGAWAATWSRSCTPARASAC